MRLAVAGDMSLSKLEEWARKYFGPIRSHSLHVRHGAQVPPCVHACNKELGDHSCVEQMKSNTMVKPNDYRFTDLSKHVFVNGNQY